MEHFFSPNSGKDQKKRSSPKMEHFFPRIQGEHLRTDGRQSQIIGGDADEDHTQIIGGIYPPSPRVSAPMLLLITYFIDKCFFLVPVFY